MNWTCLHNMTLHCFFHFISFQWPIPLSHFCLPGTQMTLVLVGKGLVLEGWTSYLGFRYRFDGPSTDHFRFLAAKKTYQSLQRWNKELNHSHVAGHTSEVWSWKLLLWMCGASFSSFLTVCIHQHFLFKQNIWVIQWFRYSSHFRRKKVRTKIHWMIPFGGFGHISQKPTLFGMHPTKKVVFLEGIRWHFSSPQDSWKQRKVCAPFTTGSQIFLSKPSTNLLHPLWVSLKICGLNTDSQWIMKVIRIPFINKKNRFHLPT